MANIDQRVLASIPKCSTGIIKTDTTSKMAKDGKWKGSDQNSLLKNTSKKNRVPVVIDSETPVEQSVYTQQDTRQVYVIQSKPDENGNINRVLIARYEDGVSSSSDPDGTAIVIIDWVDVKHVTCGSMADAVITIPGSQPVQTEPDVDITGRYNETWRLQQSYVFIDPYIFDSCVDALKRGVGIQRGIAAVLGITSDSEIKRRVHLIPLCDISENDLKTDSKLSTSDDTTNLIGMYEMKQLNGTAKSFVDFCKKEFQQTDIEVIAIFGHGNLSPSRIRLYNRDHNNADFQRFTTDHVAGFLSSITSIKKIFLLSCSVGDLRNTANLAHTIAVLGKNKIKDGVIAADGKTSTTITPSSKLSDIGDLIVRTGKYDEKGSRIKGKGWCLYRDDLVDTRNEPDPKYLSYTQAKPVKEKNKIKLNSDGEQIWKEYDIKVSELLVKF